MIFFLLWQIKNQPRRNKQETSSYNDDCSYDKEWIMVILLWPIKNQLRRNKQENQLIINIDDCSSDEAWIIEDQHEHNEAFDLDGNLIPVKGEEDETFHSHDLDMADLNGEGDGNNGFEGL